MNWLIYGANGYTGELAAREAVRRGLAPVLAGRNAERVAPLAESLGLEWRAFALEGEAELHAGLQGCGLVLNCAGPFSRTAGPMAAACLALGAHYLDVNGQIAVFESLHRLDAEARRADVVVLPGVGFDVVPSDCLAASLVEALPAAVSLTLAFEAGGGPSPGTAKTSLEGMRQGGCVRKEGRSQRVPLAWKSMRVPFAHGERAATTIPWGDVYTAHVSTGVPDIEVYIALPEATLRRLRRLRFLRPLLAPGPVQRFLESRIEASVRGPSAETRERTACELWGEARTADGRTASATMTTPNGYDLTVTAALGIVERLLQDGVEGGYYTPSLLMGSGYAATLPGVRFSRVS